MGLTGTHMQVFLAITDHHKEGVCIVWEGFVSLPPIPGLYPSQWRSACRWVRICYPFCVKRCGTTHPRCSDFRDKARYRFSFLLSQQKCKTGRFTRKLQMINRRSAIAQNQLLSYRLQLGTEGKDHLSIPCAAGKGSAQPTCHLFVSQACLTLFRRYKAMGGNTQSYK